MKSSQKLFAPNQSDLMLEESLLGSALFYLDDKEILSEIVDAMQDIEFSTAGNLFKETLKFLAFERPDDVDDSTVFYYFIKKFALTSYTSVDEASMYVTKCMNTTPVGCNWRIYVELLHQQQDYNCKLKELSKLKATYKGMLLDIHNLLVKGIDVDFSKLKPVDIIEYIKSLEGEK